MTACIFRDPGADRGCGEEAEGTVRVALPNMRKDVPRMVGGALVLDDVQPMEVPACRRHLAMFGARDLRGLSITADPPPPPFVEHLRVARARLDAQVSIDGQIKALGRLVTSALPQLIEVLEAADEAVGPPAPPHLRRLADALASLDATVEGRLP